MNDGVDAFECTSDGVGIADVPDLQLHVRRQIRGTAVSPVHLLRQVVKRANAMTALEQLIGQMRADEACTSRDQDRFAHATPMLSDLDL